MSHNRDIGTFGHVPPAGHRDISPLGDVRCPATGGLGHLRPPDTGLCPHRPDVMADCRVCGSWLGRDCPFEEKEPDGEVTS